MTSYKKQILVLLGLAVSIVFLWVALGDLELETVVDNIRQAHVGWLIAGAILYFAAVSVISLRWQFLLRGVKFVPLTALIPLVSIGYMGNNVYPFRSGEALRILLLQRNYRVPLVRATTTVVIERIFDGLVMLTFIVVPLLFLDIGSDEIRTVATIAALIFLPALAVFFALAAQPDVFRRLVALIGHRLPEQLEHLVHKLGEEIIAGLEGLRSPLHLAGAVVSSYASWMIEASVYWLVSFGFDLGVSYPVMLVVVGTVNLAGLIPASPGQIGVYEFFVTLVLVAAGVDEALAASYALTVHLVIWLPVTMMGFFFLARQGLGWSAITHARELEEKAIVR